MPQYVQASELGSYFPARRIIDLADGDNETETLSALSPATQAYIEERIANAEAEAHGYLQGRFDLPIAPVPERLKLAVGKMAIYYLFEDKPEVWLSGGNPQQDQYDIHREWLEGVKESEMFIGSEDVPASESDVLSTADGGGQGLVFGGGGLREF